MEVVTGTFTPLVTLVAYSRTTQALRQSVRASISAADVTSHAWTETVNRLVVEYLTHHGYGRTAEALAAATSTPLTESSDAIQLRASVLCGGRGSKAAWLM